MLMTYYYIEIQIVSRLLETYDSKLRAFILAILTGTLFGTLFSVLSVIILYEVYDFMVSYVKYSILLY